MKRIFSGIISHIRVKFTNIFSRKPGVKSPTLQEAAKTSTMSGGGDTKNFDSPKLTEVNLSELQGYPYCQFVFMKSGKILPYWISGSAIFEMVKILQAKCSIPGVQRHIQPNNPTSSLSGQPLHSVHPTHSMQDATPLDFPHSGKTLSGQNTGKLSQNYPLKENQ